MIRRSSKSPNPKDLQAAIDALNETVTEQADLIDLQDSALIITQSTLLHLISVIKYTKNQPDQVDFEGIQNRLEEVCSTLAEVLS